jgi:hypothetical protein
MGTYALSTLEIWGYHGCEYKVYSLLGCNEREPDVSEKHICSVFIVAEWAKQESGRRRWKVELPYEITHLTYLLAELSPSWEATSFAATQERPNIVWNPKVHHRIHRSPLLVLILSQIDPVHTIQSYLSKIYCNICPPTYVLVFLVALSF